MKCQHLLVPIDFSQDSEHAVDCAVGLAKQFQARLTLLHSVYAPEAADVNLAAYLEKIESESAEQMAAWRKRVEDAGVTAGSLMVRGVPSHKITDTARDRQADLIVMGTHGRTGLRHMLIGSVAERGGRRHPNSLALSWTVGCAIMSFVGAGVLGFAHTLPQVNLYTHGTLVTAMHGHLAFWGAYAMLVLGMIAYALPLLTGRKLYNTGASAFAFWTSNIGMVSMTGAFAVAGVTQVYLERRVGMDFLAVQEELAVRFWGLILAAALFSVGILAYVYTFVKSGWPVGEVNPSATPEYA